MKHCWVCDEDVPGMLEAIENSALSTWIRESPSIFGYTLILAAHAVGLAIVVGTATAIALRLLGFPKEIPLAAMRKVFPVTFFGFWLNAISGVLLYITEIKKMNAMPAFWGKLSGIALGMILLLIIRKRVFGDTDSIERGAVPAGSRQLAYAMLVCWYFALIAGRLTGYPGLVAEYFGI